MRGVPVVSPISSRSVWGVLQYTQDYDEKYPAGFMPTNGTNVPWAVVIQPYIKSVQLFKCPSNSSTGFMNGSNNTIPLSYMCNGGGDNNYFGGLRPMTTNIAGDGATSIAAIDSTSQVIMVSEMGQRPDGQYRSDPTVWSNLNDLWMQNHLGMSNFLFADGHVKSLKPTATGTPLNLWNNRNAATFFRADRLDARARQRRVAGRSGRHRNQLQIMRRLSPHPPSRSSRTLARLRERGICAATLKQALDIFACEQPLARLRERVRELREGG